MHDNRLALRDTRPLSEIFPEVFAEQNLGTFERFMLRLEARYGQRLEQSAHGVIWHDAPVIQMVVHGLWIACLKLADKLGLKLASAQLIEREIASRIDRLLPIGMILAYASPDAAARAFGVQVIEPALTAARAGASTGLPIQTLWEVPAGQFFVRCLKHALAYGQELRAASASLVRHNVYDAVRHVQIFRLDFLSEEQRHIAALDLGFDPAHGPSGSEQEILGCRARLADDRTMQRILSRLPVHLETIPKAISLADTTLYTWIWTQLLLATIPAPQRDYLIGGEYTRAVKQLRRLKDGLIEERLCARLRRRGWPATPAEQQLFRGQLPGQLYLMRKTLPVTLDSMGVLEQIYLEIDPERVGVDAETAGVVLMMPKADPGKAPATRRARLIETIDAQKLADAVSWKDMRAEEFHWTIESGRLNPAQLAEGYRRLHPDEQARVQASLMSEDMQHEFLAELLDRGLVEFTPELLRRYLDDLPVKTALAAITRSIYEGRKHGHQPHWYASMTPLVLGLVNRCPDKTIRTKIASKEQCAFWIDLANEALLTDNDRVTNNVPSELFHAFRKKIGSALWARLVLAAFVAVREEAFVAKLNGLPDAENVTDLPRWQELATCTAVQPQDLLAALGLSRAQAQTVVAKHTEIELLRWYASNDAQRAKRERIFRKARANYFDAQKPPAPPRQRPRKKKTPTRT